VVKYVIRRLLALVPLCLVISLLVFGINQLAPGDPVRAYIPLDAINDPAEWDRVRVALGLDKPWPVQYAKWLGKVVRGDLGRSIVDGDRVIDKIKRALPVTLRLTVTAFIFSFVLAIAIGVLSATRRYSFWDYVTTFFAFFGLCIPNFWFGLMLMLIFAVWLGVLPATGMYPAHMEKPTLWILIKHMILPVAVLALDNIAGWSRYVRSSLLEVLGVEYIRTARAKGLSERIVIYKHAMRNALMPVITFLGLGLAGFVGGSLIVESLFGWPGMGRVTVDAVFKKDYPVLMGTNLMFAVLTILGNLAADIMYAVVDPRVKYS
jgi:peptide/nickel transport system permease protein